MIIKEDLWDVLEDMGFSMGRDICIRHFANINADIRVDIVHEKIIYPEALQYERATTLNFSENENFVVLDCIVRLMEMGYRPEQIRLEAGVPGGHADNKAGYCDILVSDNDGNEYLIIECKTTEQKETDEFWQKL
ncbi:MAG: type I restriction enzyme HsdR N-terminal domain-containing protein [Lachnospiraceae bacterium]|nr:type I restriction enzyme HsdR N-terminal domain-containing protein [Lachnospiraceae bacterium]